MLYYGRGLIFSLHPYDMSMLKHRKEKKTDTDCFFFSLITLKSTAKASAAQLQEAEPLKGATTTPVLFICPPLLSVTSC